MKDMMKAYANVCKAKPMTQHETMMPACAVFCKANMINWIRNDERNNVSQQIQLWLRADVDYEGRVCLIGDLRGWPVGLIPVQVKQCDRGIGGTIGCMPFPDNVSVQFLQD